MLAQPSSLEKLESLGGGLSGNTVNTQIIHGCKRGIRRGAWGYNPFLPLVGTGTALN
jgi:hypothetical protein